MKKAILVVFIMLALVACGCATSGNLSRNHKEKLATAPETVITDIVIRDNIVDIKAGGPFTYTVYKPDDPYRVIAEIPFVHIGRHEERIRSHSAGITEVVTTQVETPRPALRIEILLQAPVEMDPSYHDNTLTLKVREAEKRSRIFLRMNASGSRI